MSISNEWHTATTLAAVETANAVVSRMEAAFPYRRGKANSPAERKRRAVEYCRKIAERAFRRPLTAAQRKFFVDAHFEGAPSLASAVKRSVILILKSPRFLYPGLGSTTFDDYDVAARLALRLWDSVPDRLLLEAAAKGELKADSQIEKHVQRMLEDPRARAKMRHVFHDWLMVDEKEGITKDANLFPELDEQVASDLRTSLDLFIDGIVWSKTSDYRRLLTSDELFVNPRLAKFYGIKPPADGAFAKVSFESKTRAGILTHPYLLSMFAYHNLSSPIHRGVFLTRRVLGRSLKPPPQATEFKDADFAPHMTTREKVAKLTKPAACMTCHSVINPLGFSLEHFDAVGRYRAKEKDRPIDVKTPFETVTGQTVQLTGARSLAKLITESRQAHGTFVDHLFHQTVKQPINAYGPKTRDELIRRFQAGKFNIRRLLVEIMKTSISYERKQHSNRPG